MGSQMETANSNNAVKAPKSIDQSERTTTEKAEVVLRFLVAMLSIAALLLLVKDRQTVVEDVGSQAVVTEMKLADVTTGFQYGVYSNGFVAFYCFVLALTSSFGVAGNVRSYGKPGAWILFILDQGFAYILLSAASAFSEVADIAENGSEKSGWSELCSTFGYFCGLLRASIVITFLSTLLLAAISVISAHQLFRQYRRSQPISKV